MIDNANSTPSTAALLEVLMNTKHATAVLISKDLDIGFANFAMLALWNKSADSIGKELMKVVPELLTFSELVQRVWDTGDIYVAQEVPIQNNGDDGQPAQFFDLEYRAIRDEEGHTYVMVFTATDVTERVAAGAAILETTRLEHESTRELAQANQDLKLLNEQYQHVNQDLSRLNTELRLSNNRLDRAEEGLRLALESADLGSWYIDAESRAFVPSVRLKQLFGFEKEQPMSYQEAVAQIDAAYRSDVLEAVERCITQGTAFDMEYPVTGYNDQERRWVRAFGKLYESTDGLAAHFSGIMLDITEQKRNEQRKNDFISMVSHELKTPLTSLSAYVQLLQRKAEQRGDKFAETSLAKANSLIGRMSSLINGFLNVSRFEDGKIYLDKSEFCMQQLIDSVLQDAVDTDGKHKITVNPCEVRNVLGDREKIGQVIENLISNALKYSPRDTEIVINCSYTDDELRVDVADKGIGVKREDQEKLFDRYYRVNDAQTKHLAGFGIGLYLSREIIRQHGGQIGVESEYGEGSHFYFTIPLLQNEYTS